MKFILSSFLAAGISACSGEFDIRVSEATFTEGVSSACQSVVYDAIADIVQSDAKCQGTEDATPQILVASRPALNEPPRLWMLNVKTEEPCQFRITIMEDQERGECTTTKVEE